MDRKDHNGPARGVSIVYMIGSVFRLIDGGQVGHFGIRWEITRGVSIRALAVKDRLMKRLAVAACMLSSALLPLCLLTGPPGVVASSADEKKDDPKPPPKPRDAVKLTDEALRIHAEAILIDGHNDLPWQFRRKADLSFANIDLTKPQPKLHTDIPRLVKGGVGAQFWSAYVPAESRKKGTAVRETLEQIDAIHRMVKAYPDTFEMASTADDIVRIRKKGKIASLIGVEGGHSIDNSLGVLRTYYTLGVRYMTLTHSETLDWADSATDKPKSNGLSEFGEQVVREMNRLGMLVDISHVSADTMKHALRVTKAPLIASHSSAYALANHPRNVPDDVLELVKKNDGVVMINFYSGFIVPEAARAMKDMFQMARDLREKYPDDKDFEAALQAWKKEHPIPTGSVHDVVDHIEHVIKIAGVDHVGIGSDFDGINSVPKQLEDVSYYPYITQELLNRGHSKEEIIKILGGNVLRVMRKAEEVAKGMK
jgi:membrane dipeptidase